MSDYFQRKRHCDVYNSPLKVTGQDSPGHRKIYAEADFLANYVHDNPEFMKWAEDWK